MMLTLIKRTTYGDSKRLVTVTQYSTGTYTVGRYEGTPSVCQPFGYFTDLTKEEATLVKNVWLVGGAV